jgi:hypothetical protein
MRVVLIGDVAKPGVSGESSTYVLPKPLDLQYIKSKHPDMVVIFDAPYLIRRRIMHGCFVARGECREQ